MYVYLGLLVFIAFDFGLQAIWERIKNEDFKITKIINFIFKYRVLTIIGFVTLSTLRSTSVGLDTFNYFTYYNELKSKTKTIFVDSIGSKFEIWFTFVNSLLAFINADFKLLLFLISIFVSISIVLFVNKFSDNKCLSLLLYVMLGVFAQSLNTLRQIIAIGLILLALIQLFDKKILGSVILILFASTFHVTAILCLVFIPLRFMKLKFWQIVLLVLGVTIISMSFTSILKIVEILTPLDFYTKYFLHITDFNVKSSTLDNLYSFGLAFLYFVFLFGKRLMVNETKETKDKYNLFLNMYLAVPLIRIAGYLTNMQTLFNRISMYFFISLMILIPMFIKAVSKNNKKIYKILLVLAILAGLCFMYFLYAIKLSCGVVPYIWDL